MKDSGTHKTYRKLTPPNGVVKAPVRIPESPTEAEKIDIPFSTGSDSEGCALCQMINDVTIVTAGQAVTKLREINDGVVKNGIDSYVFCKHHYDALTAVLKK